ncbi:MAG: sugar kinase, partial [Acidobacteria bacterium]
MNIPIASPDWDTTSLSDFLYVLSMSEIDQTVEVICIGMAVADILVRGVSNFPEGGVTSLVHDITVASGGDAINEAITLSRLGHRVGLLAAVGDDVQGDFVIRECEKHGVDVSGVSRTAKHPTATSVVLINARGERSFLSQPDSALDAFLLSERDVDRIKPGVKVVSLGSFFCGRNLHDGALVGVLRKAKAVGATTVADFVLSSHAGGLKSISHLLELVDYAAPSKEEACVYAGTDNLDEIAEEFFSYGVRNVVIKQGGEGVFVRTKTDRFSLAPYPSSVVDTTGAGDSFVAGFICGLLRGEPLRGCVMIGAATASIAIQSVGATTGVR